jgi:hypothetical protein
MSTMRKPLPGEVPEFYRGYVQLAGNGDVLQALRNAKARAAEVLSTISEDHAGHSYAPGKWSLKELLQHIIDSERIFAYRALRMARGDAQPLHGFDENAYAALSNADARSWEALMHEHDLVSASTIAMFEGFDANMLARRGMANNAHFSVEAIGWITAGHMLHHLRIISERYLPIPHGTQHPAMVR